VIVHNGKGSKSQCGLLSTLAFTPCMGSNFTETCGRHKW